MISQLLLYKILQFFIIMVLGFVLAKCRIVRSKDSMVLSKISLYLLIPVAIINSFDIAVTGEIMQGLGLAFAAAIVIHLIFLLIDLGYKKLFRGSDVERASIVYPNAGNVIIPIVTYVLGEEWVIYTCAFISVQIKYFAQYQCDRLYHWRSADDLGAASALSCQGFGLYDAVGLIGGAVFPDSWGGC